MSIVWEMRKIPFGAPDSSSKFNTCASETGLPGAGRSAFGVLGEHPPVYYGWLFRAAADCVATLTD
ncbi:MAG: hypothetical protein RLZZ458_1695 [Planctomycetota bacterium]|jgi:hypothetical protein